MTCKARLELAQTRELHADGVWLPAGQLALSLLVERLQALYRAQQLDAMVSPEGDWVELPCAARDSLVDVARAFHASLGWNTVVEHVHGPGSTPWANADLLTPRTQPGWALVLHADHAGARWETGKLEAGAQLKGYLARFAPTLLRVADHRAWPGWLAPTQLCVLPVGAGQTALASAVHTNLLTAGWRAELCADGTLARRVRTAKRRGVPGLVVVGAAEALAHTVALTWHDTRQLIPQAELSEHLSSLSDTHAPPGASITQQAADAASIPDGHDPSPNPLTGVLSH